MRHLRVVLYGGSLREAPTVVAALSLLSQLFRLAVSEPRLLMGFLWLMLRLWLLESLLILIRLRLVWQLGRGRWVLE